MTEPILYGPAISTYARTCRLALAEKGQPYTLVEVDIDAGAQKTPEHLARHPFGKVPAFEHDGFALYETAAIARYIDEAYPGPALQPEDVRARARMNQAISIVDAYAYPSLIFPILIERLAAALEDREPDEAAIAAALPRARSSIAAFEGLLADGPYLAGDALSLADLHLVPVLAYAVQTPEGAALLAAAPRLTEWWARMQARPSVIETAPEM